MRAHEDCFRKLLAHAIRKSGLTREQIALALSDRVCVRVTVSMLNDYTASSKAHTRFPATFLGALCEILGDDSLHRFAAGPLAPAIKGFEEMAEALEARKSRSRRGSASGSNGGAAAPRKGRP
jgi:hypothetical protein